MAPFEHGGQTAAPGSSAARHGEWFDTWQATEPLAVAGSVELWRATDGGASSALLRLYPRFQSEKTWRRFSAAAARRSKLDDARLLPLAKLGAHGRPHLLLSDPVGEPLATRIEREALAPAVAAAVFDDVAGGLEALERTGVGPIDITPADVFLVAGDRGLLLADAGLLGQVTFGRRDDGRPTAASMGRAFASVLEAALTGPSNAGAAAITPAIDRLLTRALADDPPRGLRTPVQIAAALRAALETEEAPGRAPAAKPRREHLRVVAGRAEARAPAPVPAVAEPSLAATETDGGSAQTDARRGVRGRLIAALAACAALGAVGGALAATATAPSDPPDRAQLAAGDLSVDAPAGWSRVSPAAAPLDVGDAALVARSAEDPGLGLAVTRSGDALLADVPNDLEPTAVALRAGDAWRYAGAEIGGRTTDVYLLPTAAGPIVSACWAPGGAGAAALAACGAGVASLRAPGAEVLPLGGAPAVRAQVADALATLRSERTDGRELLAAAGDRSAQAAAADALANAYVAAVRAGAGSEAVGLPGARTRLLEELAAAGRAYAALATAARAGDTAGFDAARARIGERERAVERALPPLAVTAATD
jgi:hypothetical protein